MHRKRIIPDKPSKRLDLFYNSIISSKLPGRGKQMVLVRTETFYKIARMIRKIQSIKLHRKYNRLDIAQILGSIYEGERYKDLYFNLPSRYKNLFLHIPRRVLSSYLQEAIKILKINVEDHKITLNTIYTSGRMIRTAKMFCFDIEYECLYYDIPVV
jgi:hypothetical protein